MFEGGGSAAFRGAAVAARTLSDGVSRTEYLVAPQRNRHCRLRRARARNVSLHYTAQYMTVNNMA